MTARGRENPSTALHCVIGCIESSTSDEGTRHLPRHPKLEASPFASSRASDSRLHHSQPYHTFSPFLGNPRSSVLAAWKPKPPRISRLDLDPQPERHRLFAATSDVQQLDHLSTLRTFQFDIDSSPAACCDPTRQTDAGHFTPRMTPTYS